jgi:hypothetical protein
MVSCGKVAEFIRICPEWLFDAGASSLWFSRHEDREVGLVTELTTILVIAAFVYAMELPFRYLVAFTPLAGRPLYLAFALVCGCGFVLYDLAQGARMAFRVVAPMKPSITKGPRR